jgi:hypothetical protein
MEEVDRKREKEIGRKEEGKGRVRKDGKTERR